MNLNEITANIRLRTPWESIDLGFSIVQKWWISIYLPFAILTFGIASVLYFIFPKDNLWIASLIFWWLKPLYDRLVLHILSHKLFNDELSSWEVFSALPSLIWNTGFFQSLTFRRLSLSRGFQNSVWKEVCVHHEPQKGWKRGPKLVIEQLPMQVLFRLCF